MPRGESGGGTGRRGLARAASELHAFLVAARLEQYEAQLAHELGAVCVDDLRELVRDPGLMAELGMPPLHEAQLAARLAEQC
jgi:hypothetical protein